MRKFRLRASTATGPQRGSFRLCLTLQNVKLLGLKDDYQVYQLAIEQCGKPVAHTTAARCDSKGAVCWLSEGARSACKGCLRMSADRRTGAREAEVVVRLLHESAAADKLDGTVKKTFLPVGHTIVDIAEYLTYKSDDALRWCPVFVSVPLVVSSFGQIYECRFQAHMVVECDMDVVIRQSCMPCCDVFARLFRYHHSSNDASQPCTPLKQKASPKHSSPKNAAECSSGAFGLDLQDMMPGADEDDMIAHDVIGAPSEQPTQHFDSPASFCDASAAKSKTMVSPYRPEADAIVLKSGGHMAPVMAPTMAACFHDECGTSKLPRPSYMLWSNANGAAYDCTVQISTHDASRQVFSLASARGLSELSDGS